MSRDPKASSSLSARLLVLCSPGRPQVPQAITKMTMDEIHQWHGYSSTDSLLPFCRYCNPRQEDKDETALDPDHDIDPPIDGVTAVNYGLAGRSDGNHSFKDFRSPSKARRRHRERNEKYYSWRAVKAGQVDRPHYTPDHADGHWFISPLPEAPVVTMSKQRLYYEAQMYPRPPKYHRSKPWEKEAWGAAHRYNGPKHALQRLGDAVDDALDFASWRYLSKHGAAGFNWTPSGFVDEVMFMGNFRNEIRSIEAEECGCACDLCHRECHEQQRRRWEAEVAALDTGCEDGDEEWDVITTPSTIAAESDEGWNLLDASSEIGDGWTLTQSDSEADSNPPPPANPFISGQDFDLDGYLPYTDTHFFSDLSTGRCRACIADHLLRTRRSHYDQTRLSDVALLRGMPIEFTTWTCKAPVPFGHLLLLLVEGETDVESLDAREVVRSARGPLAEDYYRLLAPSWWNKRDCKACPEARARYDLLWMLEVGCE